MTRGLSLNKCDQICMVNIWPHPPPAVVSLTCTKLACRCCLSLSANSISLLFLTLQNSWASLFAYMIIKYVQHSYIMFQPLFQNRIEQATLQPQSRRPRVTLWQEITMEGEVFGLIQRLAGNLVQQRLSIIKADFFLERKQNIADFVDKALAEAAQSIYSRLPLENQPKQIVKRLIEFIRFQVLSLRLFDNPQLFTLYKQSFRQPHLKDQPKADPHLVIPKSFPQNIFTKSHSLFKKLQYAPTLRSLLKLFSVFRGTLLSQNRLNLKYHKNVKIGLGIDDFITAFQEMGHCELTVALALRRLIKQFEREGGMEQVMPMIRCFCFYAGQ